MKTISIVNLKGGVGKTTTAVNMAYELAATHNQRVLLIDADHQGNSSKFYSASCDCTSLIDLMDNKCRCYEEAVQHTVYRNLDIIPSDMSLLSADLSSVALQDGRPRMRCIPDICEVIKDFNAYDFVIIDCPPAFTAASTSAIMASDDIIIPIKLDFYAIDGMQELISQLEGIRRISSVHIAGALITQWHNHDVIRQGEEWLIAANLCPVFHTHIRRTDVVDKSTYWRKPLAECSPRSAATADYAAFVCEFLEKGGNYGKEI